MKYTVSENTNDVYYVYINDVMYMCKQNTQSVLKIQAALW